MTTKPRLPKTRGELSDRVKKVWWLYNDDNKSYEQIAEKMNISKQTVKRYIQHVHAYLRHTGEDTV